MLFRAIRRAFNAGREAFGGRLCRFSVQKDHLHLIVEAANREALSRALQALAIRIARAINRVVGRTGKVFADRYHMRILKTPTEVKNALRYVLDNRWKHNPQRPDFFVEQDDCSSLAWLDSAVVVPRTWGTPVTGIVSSTALGAATRMSLRDQLRPAELSGRVVGAGGPGAVDEAHRCAVACIRLFETVIYSVGRPTARMRRRALVRRGSIGPGRSV
jgi:REP element-mobilizing transposase RayT